MLKLFKWYTLHMCIHSQCIEKKNLSKTIENKKAPLQEQASKAEDGYMDRKYT